MQFKSRTTEDKKKKKLTWNDINEKDDQLIGPNKTDRRWSGTHLKKKWKREIGMCNGWKRKVIVIDFSIDWNERVKG